MIETIGDVDYLDCTQLERVPTGDSDVRHRVCVICWPTAMYENELIAALCGHPDIQKFQKKQARPFCSECDAIKLTGKCTNGHDITTSYER